MPSIETIQELAEALADMLGIYNQGMRLVGVPDADVCTIEDTGLYDHADECQCRMCWCGQMERRICAAAAHEFSRIALQTLKDSGE